MQPETLREMIRRIDTLMEERMAAKGKTLEDKLKSVRRALPRKVAREVAFLVETDKRIQNPKLALRTDPQKVSASYGIARDWLEEIKVGKMKKRKRSGFVAGLAFQFLVVLILLLAVLRWRGFI